VENSVSLSELTRLVRRPAEDDSDAAVAENRPADVRIYLTDNRKVMGVNDGVLGLGLGA